MTETIAPAGLAGDWLPVAHAGHTVEQIKARWLASTEVMLACWLESAEARALQPATRAAFVDAWRVRAAKMATDGAVRWKAEMLAHLAAFD